MSWWESIVLGLVQGLTEFLPISSSAHLALVGQLLPSGGDPGATFTAVTQIGTEAAVVLYFRRDIVRIVKAWCLALIGKIPRNDPDAKMGWLVIVGSVPIVILGVLFQDSIRSTFRNLYLVALMLIVFGLILGWADRIGQKRRDLEDLTVRDGLFYGLAQSLALIPGVSRSGGTITAGLLMGYSREAAARYSFLLAIPAVLGSGFYELAGSLGDEGGLPLGQTAAATLVAFVVGYLVIIAFLKIISTYSYRPFVYYRLAIGVLIILACAVGWLDATPAALTTG